MWIEIAVMLVMVLLVGVFLARNKRYRWFYVIAKTYRRDIRAFAGMRAVKNYCALCLRENRTLCSEFMASADKYPEKVAFYFENEVWTFGMVQDLTNKVARYFFLQGYKKGDVIALIMENCPEYPAIWLGLSQIGVTTALINTNLSSEPLMHSLNTVKCRAIIFGNACVGKIADILHTLNGSLKLYQYFDNTPDAPLGTSINLNSELNCTAGEKLHDQNIVSGTKDPVVYIYTSGTTGFPKAARMTNLKCLAMLKTMYVLSKYQPDDIAYVPLPLYHMAGGIGGVGQTLISGATCVLARKFSASKYFEDCEKYKVTISQYIGEICRYLLALPVEHRVNHSIRIMTGNGLRPQLWRQFVERFRIKEVYEIYASTEGISNLLNIDSTPGSVGFVPRYLKRWYPFTLIKCNQATGIPIRNSAGFCVECGVDQPGLAVGKIDPNKVQTNFEGYTDEEETEKKILRDVFVKGDRYFNSGDVLMYDELGYYYFKDRTGDTFRWKGENVSTSEVESIISGVLALGDVAVYGVEIPYTEGKAGMAAIVEGDSGISLDGLLSQMRANLPHYAIPLFIRIIKSVQMTGTYKMQKVELKEEGFDIGKISDRVYFLDGKMGVYVELLQELYESIKNGAIRV